MHALLLTFVLAAEPVVVLDWKEVAASQSLERTVVAHDAQPGADESQSESSAPVLVAPPPPAETLDVEPAVSLKSRIAAYRARGGRAYYENGGNTPTTIAHMASAHGWDRSELSGLSQTELDYLHGMSHTEAPELTATVKVSTSGDSIPVEYVNGRWEWEHPTLGRRYSTNLQEGYNYKGLIYRDGAMHPESSVPLVNTQPARTGHWETRCFNGQCRRYWVWD